MTPHQITRLAVFASVSAVTAAISCTAFAQVTSNSAPPPNLQTLQAELDKSFQASGAMRVYRDPKTGEFVHQDEQSTTDASNGQRTAGGATKAKSAPIAVKRHANGMSSAAMGESGMHYATVHRHADGSISSDCVEDHSLSQALTQATSQTSQAPAKGDKHAR